MLWLLLNSASTVSRLSLFPTVVSPSEKVGKNLRRNTARTADPDWPKGYSTTRIMLSNKTGVEEKGEWSDMFSRYVSVWSS